MDRTSKILLVAAFALIAIASVYFISPKTTGLAGKESDQNAAADNIKLATFAICEEAEDSTLCKDRLFASCNHEVIEINDTVFYCGGKQYNASSLPLGETYQIQNWSDPRQKEFITAWAASD